MRRILLIGQSGGIGAALKEAFEAQGDHVVGLSRSAQGFDFAVPDQVERILGELEPGFDGIFIASGVLTAQANGPEKSLKEIDASELAANFAVNCVGPALVMKHASQLLKRRAPTFCVALSARVGSIGDNRAGGWYAYRASKVALNQIVHTAAIELARTHKGNICVAMHPGTVETSFTANYKAAPKVPAETAAENLLAVLEGLTPADSGGFYDWAGKRVPW